MSDYTLNHLSVDLDSYKEAIYSNDSWLKTLNIIDMAYGDVPHNVLGITYEKLCRKLYHV